MSINLQKGQKINLSKETSGLKSVTVGLGWQAQHKLFGKSIDCDAFAILLENGRLTDGEDLVYFGNLKHKSNSVIHKGDDLVGGGKGDNEHIVINLDKVPSKFDKIVLAVNIYQAYQKKQQFGMIHDAFIRLFNTDTGEEICRYNLTDDYKNMTCMLMGELYKHNGEWKFGAIGSGSTEGSISEFCKRYE